jgi:transposase
VSGHEIARRVGVAPSTVRLTLKRLAAVGLSWPLPADLGDAALEAMLFSVVGSKQGHRRQAEPDWATIHRELKRKHVTLSILWDEYIEQHPDGYRYSRFCELYRGWEARLSVTMRQTHAGGDKLFVDYAGDTVPVIVDRLTGETRPAQIFVAVMGASNFTYAQASWTQGLGDWIGAHTRALAAIGGVPNLLVPDNTKVAIIKACHYEPQVNRTYAEMAAHYDCAILPARPRRAAR